MCDLSHFLQLHRWCLNNTLVDWRIDNLLFTEAKSQKKKKKKKDSETNCAIFWVAGMWSCVTSLRNVLCWDEIGGETVWIPLWPKPPQISLSHWGGKKGLPYPEKVQFSCWHRGDAPVGTQGDLGFSPQFDLIRIWFRYSQAAMWERPLAAHQSAS